jgi:HSP20 family molecular chaperone IbpA
VIRYDEGNHKNEVMKMFEDPKDMFEEMDEMFARLFSRMDQEFMDGSPGFSGYRIMYRGEGEPNVMPEIEAPRPRDSTEPVTEVHRIGDEVKVIAELPGVTDESLRLDVQGDQLVIDAGDADHHYHTSATLPPVDVSSQHASVKNGVLEVTFRSLPGNVAET